MTAFAVRRNRLQPKPPGPLRRVECAVVAELVARIRDRGPEPDWHTNRSLFGPWCRFEAELSAMPGCARSG